MTEQSFFMHCNTPCGLALFLVDDSGFYMINIEKGHIIYNVYKDDSTSSCFVSFHYLTGFAVHNITQP